MATSTLPHASVEHIQRFERKVRDLKHMHAALPTADFYEQLIPIIHRPGWTTPAESLFFESAVESLMLQTRQLAEMQKQLLAASEAVGKG